MTLPDRPDLRAMGPEVLAAATNLGLVKRATRDLSEGRAPVLTADGETVVGRCDDGAEVRLPPPGSAPTCTCGAVTCRHRIATILAFRESSLAAGAAPAAPPPLPEVDAQALEAALGPKRWLAARALLDPRIVVEVLPGTAADPIPTARLPGSTVRFLTANAIAGMRCDCGEFTAAASTLTPSTSTPICVHAAIGLWAFAEYRRLFGAEARAAEKITLTGASGSGPAVSRDASASKLAGVRERTGPREGPGSGGADEANPYAPFAALVHHLLLRGVVGGAEAFATVASGVRRLDEAHAPRWLVLAVAELVAQVDAYAHRSARYDAGRVAAIAGEIVGRLRAGTEEALGVGLPAETKVGRTRLVSLGARTFADGDDRRVEVTFVDPDSSTLLLFEKSWDHAEGGEIARRPVLPRTPLGTLAEGQLISDAGVRHADGTIRFSAGRGAGTTSVLPQAGDWGRLSSRLIVRDFGATLRARTEGLPRFLGPRTRTETLAIVSDFSVESIVYVAEEQAILGALVDGQGARLFVRRRHAALAPLALPILGALLPRATFLSGDLRAEAGRLVLDPLAVVADGKVHVFDTSPAPGPPSLAPPLPANSLADANGRAPVEVGPPSLAPPLPANSLAAANGRAPLPHGSALGGDGRLDPLQRFVEDLVHGGLGRRRGAQIQAAAVAADALEGRGYLQIADKIRVWARAPEDREAFFDLLVLAAVARES